MFQRKLILTDSIDSLYQLFLFEHKIVNDKEFAK